MQDLHPAAGYFRGGLPFNRYGRGPRTLIVFQGLAFENKPLSGAMAGMILAPYKYLRNDFTLYAVLRKPGLPPDCSMKSMSDDYAAMIREEFGGPVDVIGVSTGGSIVLHFAADHPDLVRRVAIHSAAHVLSDEAKEIQLRVGELAGQRRWRDAYAALAAYILARRGVKTWQRKPAVRFGSLMAAWMSAPKDPADLVATILAEDTHDFKKRLCEITAPTLVIAGQKDPFYSERLFQETAEGIPNARLVLYKGMGHPATGKLFAQDVMAFFDDDNALSVGR